MIKKILLSVLVLVVLLVGGLAVFIWQFELDDYRQDVEALLAQQTGLTVEINGGLRLQRGSPIQLSASDVSVSQSGDQIVSFKQLSLDIDWRPLLDRQLIIDDITLQSAHINLQQDEQGRLLLPEITTPQSAPNNGSKDESLPLNEVRVERIRIIGAGLVLQQAGETPRPVAQIRNLDFTLQNVQLVQAAEVMIADWPNYLSRVALQARLTVESLSYEKYLLKDVLVKTHNEGQELLLDVSLKTLGAELKSQLKYDWQELAQSVSSETSVRGLELSQVGQLLELEQTMQGALDIDWQGGSKVTKGDLLTALAGELSVRGEQLTIKGFNLNKLLNNLVKSQELDLVDVGGFALAGPLGLLLTKGGDYGAIIQAASEGETQIRQLNMEWDIANGNANFRDVAAATDAKRLALVGDFGLLGYTFDPVTLYLLDVKGCEVFQQKIKGSVEKPEISTVAFAAKSLLNPITSIAEKTVDVVAGCTPVYVGKVAAPPVKQNITEEAPRLPENQKVLQ